MRTYNEIVADISLLLNQKGRSKAKENIYSKFALLTLELKNTFNIEISTAFLHGLMQNNRTAKQQTNRINHFLTYSGLKTIDAYKYSKSKELLKYKTLVTDYIPSSNFAIEQIRADIEFNKNLLGFKSIKANKGLLRAIGLNVNTRVQTVGKEVLTHKKRLYHMIKV